MIATNNSKCSHCSANCSINITHWLVRLTLPAAVCGILQRGRWRFLNGCVARRGGVGWGLGGGVTHIGQSLQGELKNCIHGARSLLICCEVSSVCVRVDVSVFVCACVCEYGCVCVCVMGRHMAITAGSEVLKRTVSRRTYCTASLCVCVCAFHSLRQLSLRNRFLPPTTAHTHTKWPMTSTVCHICDTFDFSH